MKKIFTLLTAVLCGLALNAKTLYLNPGPNWGEAGAKFALYYFNAGSEGVWGDYMTQTGSVYQGELPDGYAKVIFVRLNPQGAINWDSKWNQTADLDVPANENLYTMTDWEHGSWSVYDGGSGEGGGQGGGDNPGGGQGGGDNPTAYWYWKGNVDGDNIENEEMGSNIFQGGLSSIDVGEAAYVFVIYQVKGVQGVQYMASGWHPEEQHLTMTVNGDNKLYVPAGSYTLYLYDNEDGTVELSYVELQGKKLMGGGEGGGQGGGDNPGGQGQDAVDNVTTPTVITKTIENGQVVIIKNGIRFNLLGAQLH